MPYRVSSNLTMLLKIIIPTIWVVFFGSFAFAFFVADPSELPLLYNPLFKWGFLLAFLFFFLILRFTLMKLLRVEMDETYIYASTYFKTYRYLFTDVEGIKEDDWWLFKLIRIQLKDKGRLGKTLPFIASRARFDEFLKENVDQFSRFTQ